MVFVLQAKGGDFQQNSAQLTGCLEPCALHPENVLSWIQRHQATSLVSIDQTAVYPNPSPPALAPVADGLSRLALTLTLVD